ncbi:MAG: glycosyltransferase family 39 protein, partial [Planctomycetaceae bacterium]|nr:glycosyltransferase family 39 protein [Planctomycetaceae bacterium]
MNDSTKAQSNWRNGITTLIVIALLPLGLHVLTQQPVEPVFGGDSNRHVMTSVFFRDFLTDADFTDPKGYAERYYEQYPALGLLIWPPLFHGVCGVMMCFLGTSVSVARLLVALSLVSSAWCVYRFTHRIADKQLAMLTTIVFATMPIIFQYGRDVMLEMPAMALILLSVDQFDLWSMTHRPRNLYLAALSASLAALTRFDAAVLLPFYATVLVFRGGWTSLLNRHTVIAVSASLCITGPVYLLIAKEMGKLHVQQATESVGGSIDGSVNGFMAFKNLWFYPSSMGEQTGWIVSAVAVLGLILVLRASDKKKYATLLGLVIATYITFTPLAEQRARHGIYWLPSVAFFAAFATDAVARFLSRTRGWSPLLTTAGAYAALLSTTATAAMYEPTYRVVGYREAAEFVLEHTEPGDAVFFDGWWDGNFTYFMRHLDPTRSRRVLRGDRILYDFTCIPTTNFESFAESDSEMLKLITDAAPRYVVLEYPQFYMHIEKAEQLRRLVHSCPAQFEPVTTVSVDCSIRQFCQFELQIFRFHPAPAGPL